MGGGQTHSHPPSPSPTKPREGRAGPPRPIRARRSRWRPPIRPQAAPRPPKRPSRRCRPPDPVAAAACAAHRNAPPRLPTPPLPRLPGSGLPAAPATGTAASLARPSGTPEMAFSPSPGRTAALRQGMGGGQSAQHCLRLQPRAGAVRLAAGEVFGHTGASAGPARRPRWPARRGATGRPPGQQAPGPAGAPAELRLRASVARRPPAPLPRFLGTDRAAPRTGRTDEAAAARVGDPRIGDIEPRPAGRGSFWPPPAENAAGPRDGPPPAPRATRRGSGAPGRPRTTVPTHVGACGLCRRRGPEHEGNHGGGWPQG